MKLIIAGSRDFNNYKTLEIETSKFIRDHTYNEPITVVCGMARGADLLGKKFAEENSYNVIERPANWILHGKSAGYRRNEEMATISTHCIVFRVGGESSKGSTHMINLAKKHELVLKVIDL